MRLNYSLNDIITIIGDCTPEGSTGETIRAIASLKTAKPGDLSFLGNAKYKADVPSSNASIILVNKNYAGTPKENQVLLHVEDPSYALLKISHEIEKEFYPYPEPGTHPTAFVDPSANVSDSAYIGPFCVIQPNAQIGKHAILEAHVFIGSKVSIGDDTHIAANVSIHDYCEVGKDCYINANAVIGSQGYGYSTVEGKHYKEPQVGRVVLEDHVDIGAGTTIDRARFSETRIGEGTKIDNLVQIAHNVIIGKHCLIVAQVGISGSTIIDDHVVIGGQAGIAGHLKIGKACMIGAQSGINHNLEPKSYVRGSPAYPYQQAQKVEIYKKRLPEFYKRLTNLEEQFASFNQDTSHLNNS
ncbi:MAG: UDP-3-O-(3-hydroxymyristoyl)glucosamine N-acyltransferase [Verrucomicrobia bacterium CG_4_10_14_3_um_filter_43_23]|nr:MAG: UDP-3-O-(3-hydroxymyristoyl)glucosamine N-acyltransferase [Verrucomicrobia bacterium CG1_02_43_26]PIP59336.1 MAG: UDP-3-O-(3-hydroxymyristoyl)glucosamine N-acyltransferase [Verrucomicrobia bacterium CG22_combo_CG10-13_8_21_14_all_43_17]PIX57961.1 MAG: UDP-3-O-(3-hydroxymyristoyl)glucosamine N-acyltransferase [Verrucomicrobia bacterium CG_4_10_14_3_um_filter_43_23]PIY62837.1 MAG: UDP-3-O-(3-hydroxymyristoyl)glucosamine N-acyltransferase [Verrucomicrobia bacterium CG_4_10_14_0_8_um_filter_